MRMRILKTALPALAGGILLLSTVFIGGAAGPPAAQAQAGSPPPAAADRAAWPACTHWERITEPDERDWYRPYAFQRIDDRPEERIWYNRTYNCR